MINPWPRLSGPVALLQVFNRGQPCGWLGQHQQGFWFHYNSASAQQPWLSLLMPPSQNFYQSATLFEVFAQHLPTPQGTAWLQQFYPQVHLGALELLALAGANTLGSLSFANPDAPLVQPRVVLNTAQLLALPAQPDTVLGAPVLRHFEPTQHANYLASGTARYNNPDLWVFSTPQTKAIQIELAHIAKETDPNGLLRGLQWVEQVQAGEHWAWCPRPEFDAFRQHRLGLDSFASVLNLSSTAFVELMQQPKRFRLVACEVIRTYCRNTALEIERFEALIHLLQAGHIQAHLVYEQPALHSPANKPQVLGVEYF
jgi:hypothetical protein